MARTLDAADIPYLIGELETIRCIAVSRLSVPASTLPPDENLEVPEAAHRLGVSPDYLYRNHKKFPFTRREGRKLLFSSNGIDAHLKGKQK
jgi:hypothetical protein